MEKVTKNKRTMVVIFVLVALLIALVSVCLAAFDTRLKVRHYDIDSEKISSPVRIALVTDLHSCKYGEGQRELVDAIDKQKPDVVFLVGDIFDDVLPDENTTLFIEAIAHKYPCYYVTGNHEWWSGKKRFCEKMSVLEANGVEILNGECVTLDIGGEKLDVCGVDDPAAYDLDDGKEFVSFKDQLALVDSLANKENYTVLLSHRPEHYELYSTYGFDLVLSGHAHGGQWRVPLLINGIYAPHQGVLPKYAGGMYDDGTDMIVSRGLARETTRVPRIFNRPELVIINIG